LGGKERKEEGDVRNSKGKEGSERKEENEIC
jgi:hypothetical protein